jgi:hypothetical protein
LRDHVAQLGVAHVKLGVIGAQMRRDRFGELRLVVAFLVKADGIRVYRLCTDGAINPTMAELSTPPDRKAPSGTSDIICRSTASISSVSNASVAASGVICRRGVVAAISAPDQ